MDVETQSVPLMQGSAQNLTGLKTRLGLLIKARQVPPEQVVDLVEQLGIMFETGMNLSAALEVLERQAGTAHLRDLVGDIRSRVEGGSSLSQAMGRHSWAFGPVALALVRAGEMTGDLGAMLRKVSEFMERDIETAKKVRGAMAYPLFMLFMAVCVVVFLLVQVFPKFAELFKDAAKLPGPTRMFMTMSDFLTQSGVWLFPLVLLGGLGTLLLARSRRGHEILDPIYLRLPAVGSLIKAVAISRSFHVLGVMLNAGLNVLEALTLAADVSGNNEYRKLWVRARSEVEQDLQPCRAKVIDLAADLPADRAAAMLCDEIAAPDGACEIQRDEDRRRVLELRVEKFPVPDQPLEGQPVFVLTGGTRGITALVARDLARRGPCRLALFARTAPAVESLDETAAKAEIRAGLDAEGVRATPVRIQQKLRRLLPYPISLH